MTFVLPFKIGNVGSEFILLMKMNLLFGKNQSFIIVSEIRKTNQNSKSNYFTNNENTHSKNGIFTNFFKKRKRLSIRINFPWSW